MDPESGSLCILIVYHVPNKSPDVGCFKTRKKRARAQIRGPYLEIMVDFVYETAVGSSLYKSRSTGSQVFCTHEIRYQAVVAAQTPEGGPMKVMPISWTEVQISRPHVIRAEVPS